MVNEQIATSEGTKSSLRRMMMIFLLTIVTAVIVSYGWIVWNWWNRMITSSQNDTRNLSQSLSRQTQDTFLQVDLTLQDLRNRKVSCRSCTVCIFTTVRATGRLRPTAMFRSAPITETASIFAIISKVSTAMSISARRSAAARPAIWYSRFDAPE